MLKSCLCIVLFFLVSALSSPGEDTKVILLMTYKRINILNETIHNIASISGGSLHHLVVTQSFNSWDTQEIVEGVDTVLGSYSFASVTHLVTVDPKINDSTFSTDKMRYGTKRGSFLNLHAGMKKSYELFPDMQYLIIIEDDILLSADTFTFFDRCQKIMNRKHDFSVATTFHLFRYGHYKWGEYRHKSYRLHRPDPKLIMAPVMKSIQFKTFAWMVPRRVWDVVSEDMQSIADWTSDEEHPLFKDCWYCCTFCYDHFIEHRFKHWQFLAPDVARATQRSRGGMTEFANNATSQPIYLSSVEEHAFIDYTLTRTAVVLCNIFFSLLLLAGITMLVLRIFQTTSENLRAKVL